MLKNQIVFKRVLRYINILLILNCLVSVPYLRGQKIDILLKGGHVIDPKNNIDSKMDVGIIEGKIAQVASNIPESNAIKVIDVSGLYVTPGIIDMHTHVFFGTSEATFPGFEIKNGFGSVNPDDFAPRSGVTTVVDAGSSGWRDFHTFKKQTVDNSQTRVLAFINITGNGMVVAYEQDTTDMNPLLTSFVMKEYPDIIVGIKAAHYQGHGFTMIDRAVEAGKLTNKPVIVDFGGTTPPLSIEELLMEHLRPGDILTHTYAYSLPRRESVVDENDKVKPFIFKAQESGRIFDVGHGAGAFVWHVAINSIKQGFLPNTISTDLYRFSRNAGMKDMSNVMSKFLNLGLSIQDVILRSTWNPANVIQRTDLGNLSVGSEADVAVFKLEEGNFGFVDARKTTMNGTKKLVAELTILAGKIEWDLNGISGPQWNAK